MQFLMLYRPEKTTTEPCAAPSPEHMAEMGRFVEQSRKEGLLLHTGAILGGATSARVRQARGEVTASDGPFPETKGFTGFALIQAASREEAVASARKFLKVAGDGDTEILQLMDPPG